MPRRAALIGAIAILVSGSCAAVAAKVELLKNAKVIVTEETLAPSESQTLTGDHASVVVYLDGGETEITFAGGPARRETVTRGEAVNEPAWAATLTNTGSARLRLVRVGFLTGGKRDTWGMTGLPPNYKLLFEDDHSRTYEIRIAAHEWEPMHTHHDRVVVCLSGARLEHVMADGSKQPSTLRTNEVVWRSGQTHKGHNIGKTDLWVIAIEPK
jgi:mannose-6-phosphate isomerase-like protein (cupin superfamily)